MVELIYINAQLNKLVHSFGIAIFGGIDKRILATTKDKIDKELERILPVMRERGGYIPTCDHGVPEEVSLENYMHYRKRALELGS